MERLFRMMYWNRGRLRAGTFLFGFMLFASAVMLRMPSAFLMTIPHPTLEAEDGRFTAEGGESLEMEFPGGRIFELRSDGSEIFVRHK